MTPGAYLKMRRTAAGLSLRDVAARLVAVRRYAEHIEVEQLALIEADAQPACFSTIAALHHVYPFGLTVLGALDAIAQGHVRPEPELCRICACSEEDPCWEPIGDDGDEEACAWSEPDLCTRCATLINADRQYHAGRLPAAPMLLHQGGESTA